MLLAKLDDYILSRDFYATKSTAEQNALKSVTVHVKYFSNNHVSVFDSKTHTFD